MTWTILRLAIVVAAVGLGIPAPVVADEGLAVGQPVPGVRPLGADGKQRSRTGLGAWDTAFGHLPVRNVGGAPQFVGGPAPGHPRALRQPRLSLTTGSAASGYDANVHIYALAADASTSPTTVYAGIQLGGVLKSTDRGTSWTAVNNGLTSTRISALALDTRSPGTLYAGTSYDGVVKTTDNGRTWRPVSQGLTVDNIAALAVDESMSPIPLYAGTTGGGSVHQHQRGNELARRKHRSHGNCRQGAAVRPGASRDAVCGHRQRRVHKR